MSQEEILEESRRAGIDGEVERLEDGQEKFVPVGEAIKYRRRAQAAEAELSEVKGRMQNMGAELERAKVTIDQLDRRQQIDALLVEADAVDMEVARLLTEAAVEMMDQKDVQTAVEELKRHKPYLFRRSVDSEGSMSAQVRTGSGMMVDRVRQQAVSSGNRRDLLKYLRMKRKG